METKYITINVSDYRAEQKARKAYKRRKMIEQKLMGLMLIGGGIFCAAFDPQEGGAGLILVGGLGLILLLSKKQMIY